MLQASENVIVLQPGDQIPDGTNDSIKILLVGSESVDDTNASFNWQQKFIDGLISLSNPNGGIMMFKNKNYIIINSKYSPQLSDPSKGSNSPEVREKYNYILDMANAADAIFCNILKKTQSPLPLFLFGLFCASNKLIVRCPDDYPYSGIVNLICSRSNIPVLPSKSSVKDVVFSMYASIPKFQELQKYQLPE